MDHARKACAHYCFNSRPAVLTELGLAVQFQCSQSLCSSVREGCYGNSCIPPRALDAMALGGISTLPLISCITLGKSFNLFVPRLPLLQGEARKNTCLLGLWQRQSKTMHVKCPSPLVSQWPRHPQGGNNNHPDCDWNIC